MQFIIFSYSSKLGLPVVAFEELEKALKRDSKAVLKYDPSRMKDIPYIRIIGSYSMSAAQEWEEPVSFGKPPIRDPEFTPLEKVNP